MITMSLDAHGLKELKPYLKTLEKVGNAIKAVELNQIPRKDGGPSNAQILDWLDELSYRFTEMDAADNERIAEEWVKKFEELKHTLEIKKGGSTKNKMATNVAAKSWKAAMEECMRIVSDNIDEGRHLGKDLEPSTKETKQREYGYVYPIGKATGELLANLNPSGPGGKKIKPKTK